MIVVHLYGRPMGLPSIGLPVIEDAAHAHGALASGAATVAAAYSFYPTKNLGGIGDGGAVVTDDPELAQRVRLLRTHGLDHDYLHTEISGNARLSEIEAAWLRIALVRLDGWNERRREIAHAFREAAPDLCWQSPDPRHVYHLCVGRVSKRDEFRKADAVRECCSLPVRHTPTTRIRAVRTTFVPGSRCLGDRVCLDSVLSGDDYWRDREGMRRARVVRLVVVACRDDDHARAEGHPVAAEPSPLCRRVGREEPVEAAFAAHRIEWPPQIDGLPVRDGGAPPWPVQETSWRRSTGVLEPRRGRECFEVDAPVPAKAVHDLVVAAAQSLECRFEQHDRSARTQYSGHLARLRIVGNRSQHGDGNHDVERMIREWERSNVRLNATSLTSRPHEAQCFGRNVDAHNGAVLPQPGTVSPRTAPGVEAEQVAAKPRPEHASDQIACVTVPPVGVFDRRNAACSRFSREAAHPAASRSGRLPTFGSSPAAPSISSRLCRRVRDVALRQSHG